METTLKVPTAQAIMLTNWLESDPGIIALKHTGGSVDIDQMMNSFVETGEVQNLLDAIEHCVHEYTGKLQDTKFLNAEEIDNSKALGSLFYKTTASFSTTEELAMAHAAFTAVNDIEGIERIEHEAFKQNAAEEKILSSDNAVLKAIYKGITTTPEFLHAKLDKFLSTNERQETMKGIVTEFLNVPVLNYAISEIAGSMRYIEAAQREPVNLDSLEKNTQLLHEKMAFLDKLNENGTTEDLFENVERATGEMLRLADNSVSEARGIDKAFSTVYDQRMNESMKDNPEELPVSQNIDAGRELDNDGHKM